MLKILKKSAIVALILALTILVGCSREKEGLSEYKTEEPSTEEALNESTIAEKVSNDDEEGSDSAYNKSSTELPPNKMNVDRKTLYTLDGGEYVTFTQYKDSYYILKEGTLLKLNNGEITELMKIEPSNFIIHGVIGDELYLSEFCGSSELIKINLSTLKETKFTEPEGYKYAFAEDYCVFYRENDDEIYDLKIYDYDIFEELYRVSDVNDFYRSNFKIVDSKLWNSSWFSDETHIYELKTGELAQTVDFYFDVDEMIITEDKIYTSNGHALDRNGNEIDQNRDIVAYLSWDENSLIYIKSAEHYVVVKEDLVTGKIIWKTQYEGPIPSSSSYQRLKDYIVVKSENRYAVISKENGESVWQYIESDEESQYPYKSSSYGEAYKGNKFVCLDYGFGGESLFRWFVYSWELSDI